MKYEMNEVKLDISNYTHYWRGIPKIGKTSTFRDLVIAAFGAAKHGLLLSIGQEIGYKALKNLFAHNCAEWLDFVTTVDDLVYSKGENEFKMLGIDTVDELVELAERRVLDLHRQQKGEIVTSINMALGGYGAGKRKARALIEEQIGRLERAGYGMVYIGHTKVKDLTDPLSEKPYQMVTGSLDFAYDAIFADRADFMPMFAMDVAVQDERKIGGNRVIYFRSNNYIDAGSRLPAGALPEKIDLDATQYLRTIETALEQTAGTTSEQAKTIRMEEEKARIDQGMQFSEASKAKSQGDDIPVEEFRATVLATAKALSEENRAIKKDELTHAGLPSKFSDVTDMEILKKIYAILKRDC